MPGKEHDDGAWEPTEVENVQGIGETELALHCRTMVGETELSFWVPKSLIDDDSEVYAKGTDGTLVIPEWLAMEKGLV